MRKLGAIGIFALACALILGALDPSLAQAAGRLGRSGGMFDDGGLGVWQLMNPRAMEELKLTESQAERARELFRENRQARIAWLDGSTREAMRDLRRGLKVDGQARESLESRTADRILMQARALSGLYGILTPEQRQQFQARLDRIGKREGWEREKPRMERKQGPQDPAAKDVQRKWTKKTGEPGPAKGEGQHREGRLNLTAEQKLRVEVLSKSWMKAASTRRNETARLRGEMVKLAFSAKPDTSLLGKKAEKMADLTLDGISERARHREAFRSLLTDEQKKLLDARPLGHRPGRGSR